MDMKTVQHQPAGIYETIFPSTPRIICPNFHSVKSQKIKDLGVFHYLDRKKFIFLKEN
jgi:hypothetical protein